MSHQGTSEARGGAEVVCNTHRGLCMADRRATIAPCPRGARRIALDDYSPEVPRRVAQWVQRASQSVFGWPGLQASWWVHTRRRNTIVTMHDREDRPMAHKGRGIFLVY